MMEKLFTPNKFASRLWGIFLLTIMMSAFVVFNASSQAYQRVYADSEINGGTPLLSSIDDPLLAADGNPSSHSTLTITVIAEVWQELQFTGTDQPAAGDAVHIKIGTGTALLGLLTGAEVQAYNNGAAVGTAVELGALISLLNGADQQEIVFSPGAGVTYDAVRITNTAITLGGGLDIYEAYFYKQVAGPIACDVPVDVLYGSTGSIAGGLNAVEDPYNAIDGNPLTAATIRANVSALNKTHLTALYPVTSPAGDSIRFIIENPDGGLLDADVLATDFTIRTYNDHTDNGALALDPALIRLSLFPGSTGVQVLTYAVDASFNRVELSLGEGLATALDDLVVYEIGRIAVGPSIGGLTDGVLNVCLGDPVNLAVENPATGIVYNWYTQPIGGTAVATGSTYGPGALAVGEHIYYVSATKAECTTESGRTMVKVLVNNAATAANITTTDLTLCEGEQAILTPTATGITGTLVYRWYANADKTGEITTGIAADGTLTVDGLSTTTTYYVSVSSEDFCENAAGDLKPVTVTVNPAPVVPTVASANYSISPGQSVTLQADLGTPAPANVEVIWYTAATGGTVVPGGAAPVVSPTATTIYYAEAHNTVTGCVSATRAEVTVTVLNVPAPPTDCNTADQQVSGTDGGLLCIACQVTDPGNSIDNIETNYTRLTLGVSLAGGSVYQQLIFPTVGVATDSIRVRLTLPGGLADADLLGSTVINVMNGATVVNSYNLESSLIDIKLLSGDQYNVTVPAGGAFDGVEVRLNGGLLTAITSLDIYGARIIYPDPVIVSGDQTICAGETATLEVTAEAGLTVTWYDSETATSGTTGLTYDVTPTATTTYYVEVSRNGCANPNRIPVTVTVTDPATAANITIADLNLCEGEDAILTPATDLTGGNATFLWYEDNAKTTPITTGVDANGMLTISGLAPGTYTYYVSVSDDAHCENLAGTLKEVTVTVNPAPAAPTLASSGISITPGQSVTLQADLGTPAPANVEVRWYDAATGGNLISGGAAPVVSPTVTTIYYAEAHNTVTGCVSTTRAEFTVTVVDAPAPPSDCNTATQQVSGTDGGVLCVACQVTNPTNSIDADPATFTRLTLGVSLAGGSVYQQLIFPTAGVATDSIRVRLTLPGGLADADLLGSTVINVMNGATVVNSYNLESSLIDIKLLSGDQYNVTVPAGGAFDGVEVRLNGGLLTAITSLDIYGARIIYPDPVIVSGDQTICAGETATLEVTAAAGLTVTWYDSETATTGTTGLTYPVTPTATTTYYVEVSRGTCANPNRIPVTVTVTDPATAANIIISDLTLCEGEDAILTPTTDLTGANVQFLWYADNAKTTPITGDVDANGVLTVSGLAVGTHKYYVSVSDDAHCANPAGTLKEVTVTVNAAPVAPTVASANVTISAGQSTTLTAVTADPALPGVEVVWFDDAGTELFIGESFTTPVLNATTTYHVANRVIASGCLSATRVPVTVTVLPVVVNGCLQPSSQTIGSRILCTLCSVENPELAIDGDMTTASRLVAPVIGLGGAVWQDLIFASPGKAGDTVVVYMGVKESLLDASLLASLKISTYADENTNNNDGNTLNDNLLTLRLLADGTTTRVTFIAGADFDRIRVEQTGVLSLLESSYLIYGAEIQLPQPVVLPPAGLSVCQGGTATLIAEAAPGTTLLWYDAITGGNLLFTGDTFVSDPLTTVGPVTFYIAVDRAGCTDLNRIPVTVNVTPAFTAADIDAGPGVVCPGGSVTLFAAPANGVTVADPTFTWYSDANLTTVVGAGDSLNVTPTADITYYVTMKDGSGGCENLAGTGKAVPVTIDAAPAAPTLELAALTACQGDMVNFIVQNPAQGVEYRWYDAATGGTLIHTGDTLEITAATSGSYFVEALVINGGCKSATRTEAVLTVTPRATAADISVIGNEACAGFAAALTASSTTVTNPVFTWYSDATLATQVATGATFTTPALTADKTYYVTVSGDGICANAAADAKVVAVTVNPAPDAPTVASANITISTGTSTVLTASSTAGTDVFWFDAATAGTELGANPYTTNVFTTPGTYTFYAEARNSTTACASLTRTEVTVTVEGAGPGVCLMPNAQTVGSRAICVLCSVENPTNAVDNDLTTYSRLRVPASLLSGALWQDLIFATPGKAGDTVVIHFGFEGSLLDASVLGNLKIRTFDGTTENNDGSVAGGNLLDLRVLPQDGSRGEIVFIAGADFDRVRVEQTALLDVLNSNARIYGAEIRLPAPTALPPSGLTVCLNGTLTVSATPAAGTELRWYDAPVNGALLHTGNDLTYTPTAVGVDTVYLAVARIQGTTSCENDYRYPVAIDVTPAFTADDINALGAIVCQGGDVTLYAEPATGVTVADPIFTWYSDANLTTVVGTGDSLVISPAVNATYYVTMKEGTAGCENLPGEGKAVTVTVTNAPAAPTLVADALTACAGDVVTFEISNPAGNVTYNWYDAASGGQLLGTGSTFTRTATLDSVFYVEVMVNGGGCTSLTRSTATLTVTPRATAVDIDAAGTTLCAGGSYTLTASSTTVTAPVFTWYSDAALTTVITNLTVSPTTTTTYYVTVQGTGLCENAPGDAKEVVVTVNPAPAAPTVASSNVTISTGTSAVLSASSATGTEVVWYDAATGGNELAPGNSYTTPVLTAPGTYTYYAGTRNTTTQCLSLTRIPVIVTVEGIGPGECLMPNAQSVGSRAICLLCSVTDAGNAVDNDLTTYSQFNVPASVTGALWQDLIFATPGKAGDTVVVHIGSAGSLLDVAIFDGLKIRTFNGTTENSDGSNAGGNLLDLRILPQDGARAEIVFIAGADFDRIRFEQDDFISLLNSGLRIYGAEIRLPALTVVTPDGTSVCQGEVATLEATPAPGTTLRWYDAPTGGSLLFEGDVYVTDPLMTAGEVTYYVVVTRDNCENKVRVPVTVTVTPAATQADVQVTGNEQPVCTGVPVVLTPSSTTIAAPTFKWYKDNNRTLPIADGDTDGAVNYAIDAAGVLTITGLDGTSSPYTYYVSVQGSGLCENMAGDLRKVDVTISPTAQPDDIADITVSGDTGNGICLPPNGVVTLTAALSATSTIANPVFHWYDANGDPQTGGATGVLTISGLAPGTYTYSVGVSGDGVCETAVSDRKSVTFTINRKSDDADITATGGTICEGESFTLTASSSITGAVFSWYSDATLATPITDLTVSPTATTTYYVTVFGNGVCVGDAAEVTVTVNPRATAVDIMANGTTICEGESFTLTASSTTVTAPVFTWYSDAALTTVITDLEVSPTATTTYYVTVKGDGVCENAPGDAKEVIVTVNPGAIASDITANGGTICAGETFTLSASSATITAPVFTWYSDAALTTSVGTGASLDVTPTATTTYYVTVQGTGVCENAPGNAKEVIVTVNPRATAADITANGGTICVGDMFTLSASSTTVTAPIFTWYTDAALTTSIGTGATLDVTPTANTTYYVTVQGTGVCENAPGDAKEVVVQVGRKGTAADITADGALSCGDPVTLTASSTIANAMFTWYSDAALTTQVGTGASIEVNPTTTTDYYVTVMGDGVCENAPGDAKVVTVTVGQEPTVPVITNTNFTVCPGASITLEATSQNGTVVTWYDAATGGNVVFTGNSFTTPEITANTTYYAEASSGSCVSTTRAMVEVMVITPLDAPQVACQERTPSSATFAWQAVPGAIGYQVNVNGQGWEEPSSGATGLTHTVDNADPLVEYTIVVKALSADGECGNSEGEAVSCEVETFDDLYIPNAFTPNGDGANDLFFVRGTYQSLVLKIYNQWGNLVFETTDKNKGWDGTYKGATSPAAVYVYQVEVTLPDGTTVHKDGSISLIR